MITAVRRANGEWPVFLQEAARATTDNCIEGGGTVRPKINNMNASRYVWIVANGDPGELFVLHTCDNGLCVNIRHLYLGTQSRNVLDEYERDRRAGTRYARGPRAHLPHVNYARGERARRAALTADKVRDIRKRYALGETQQSLADEYGVSQVAISVVVRRKSWAHIE